MPAKQNEGFELSWALRLKPEQTLALRSLPKDAISELGREMLFLEQEPPNAAVLLLAKGEPDHIQKLYVFLDGSGLAFKVHCRTRNFSVLKRYATNLEADADDFLDAACETAAKHPGPSTNGHSGTPASPPMHQ